MSSIPSSLRRLGLLLAALLVVSLLAAEITARVYWDEWATGRAGAPPELPPGVELDSLPEIDSLLELRQPYTQGLQHGVFYRSNAHGLRGPDYGGRPAPGVLRIAVVGDSIALGAGVPEASTYAALLGPMLEAARPGLKAEVLNAGLGGLNAPGVMGRRDLIAKLYRPHIFVWGYTLDDIHAESYERVDESRTDEFQDRARSGLNSPSYLWRLAWLRRLKRESPGNYRDEVIHNYMTNYAAQRVFMDKIKHFGEERLNKNSCALLLLQPRLVQLDESHPFLRLYQLVKDVAELQGVPVATSFDAFVGRRAEELWVSPANPHPNEQAHALLADSLLAGILRLPDTCLSPLRSPAPEKSLAPVKSRKRRR